MATEHEPESYQVALQNQNQNVYKVYKERWLILALFFLYSISNLIQYMEFSTIANILTEYYQVSYSALGWTSMIASVIYTIFSIPGSFIIDRIGIRKTLIIGLLGTCIGSWIKVGSAHPDRFWLIILGQGIVTTFHICIFPLLPKIAATWFGYNEVATAIGIGCIGTQLGCFLSYFLPPYIVFNGEQAEIEKGLFTINLMYAAITLVLVPLIILYVREAPPTPPSIAQHNVIKRKLLGIKGFIETCKSIICVKPFLLYLVIYTVNLAVSFPIQILSYKFIYQHYPNSNYHVGIIGLLYILFGFVGSISTGIILDKFKQHKIICWSLYFSYFVSQAFTIGTLDQGIAFVYVASICTGFFDSSITTSGIAVMVEFTYPAPESVAVGFSHNCVQALCLIFSIFFHQLFETIDIFYTNCILLILIVIVDILFLFLKFDLKKKTIQDTNNKIEASMF